MVEQSRESLPCTKIKHWQKKLTAPQQAFVRQLRQEQIKALFSCELIDEREAEAHLEQAYGVRGLASPSMRWFDSPYAFVQVDALQPERENLFDLNWLLDKRKSLFNWRNKGLNILFSEVQYNLYRQRESIEKALRGIKGTMVGDVQTCLAGQERRIPGWEELEASVERSVQAYDALFQVGILYHVYHKMWEESDLIHFMRFNRMVSGYYLGLSEAWLVHKPTLWEVDEQGRLHSAQGMCLAYRDGWGVYAWHGVVVPERVILYPEALTREDWIDARDMEVRRVIQERMPDFAKQVGGRFLDGGTRGCLYAVDLGGDPENVAHYVQVYDPSTSREYYLRVPPSIQRADDAVAWTFGLDEQGYQPVEET